MADLIQALIASLEPGDRISMRDGEELTITRIKRVGSGFADVETVDADGDTETYRMDLMLSPIADKVVQS